MKKTSLIFAALFATTFAMAQNTATTTQTGNGNGAETTQTGNNTSTTTQAGPNNIAETTQVGQNSASINQSNFATPGHFASISQQGDQGSAGIGNSADIVQQQRGASATIEQVGDNNRAGLTQAGPNDAGTAVATTAGIYQKGNDNLLSTVNGNGVIGNANGSAYMQNGTSFPNDKSFLQVDQLGDGNKAGVYLMGGTDASILQDGNLNSASINSQSNATGALNLASIAQTGDENTARIDQGPRGSSLFSGDDNHASIGQDGFDNTASINQFGEGNRATLTQLGDLNLGTISQTGIGHIATMTQNGMSNTAVITQTGN
ncbi:hypothetical protein [Belliella aquatica]|uniref:Curlin associated repeat-containing protein n=1 Tax=Belliella aquatica TaxID=1323734 RepID=A0ABQ1MI69_9BACT|nr:hypothetical protein [Belliella aquatica]MCH7405142.1 hypothetical protein [Belliella aquatica]GGC39426.1 hypothetical protein GCM10010993_17730 [Belliella aquatica]